MPETSDKPNRTQIEIQEEYKKLCSLLGDKTYRKLNLEAECDHICRDLFTLNKEFSDSQSTQIMPNPSEFENPQETKTP